MGEKTGKERERDAYQDFLGEVSDQVSGNEAEQDFIESIGSAAEEEEKASLGDRVRSVRESRGLSLEDISQRTGLDVDMIKDVERGVIAPPLGTIIRLAKALEMKIGYFISGEQNRPYTIVRMDERKVISRYDSNKSRHYGYEFQSLAPHKKDRHMEPFLVTLSPSVTETERSSHDGQEFIYVIRGCMEVRLGDEVHVLNPKECIYYDSTVPHLVKCHGGQSTLILAVLYAEK